METLNQSIIIKINLSRIWLCVQISQSFFNPSVDRLSFKLFFQYILSFCQYPIIIILRILFAVHRSSITHKIAIYFKILIKKKNSITFFFFFTMPIIYNLHKPKIIFFFFNRQMLGWNNLIQPYSPTRAKYLHLTF